MKARTFALVFGIAYFAAGLLGLIPAALVPPPADAPPTHFALMYGYLLGLFPVNIVHTALNLAIGAWGLAAWSGRTSPARYARALAVICGVLAVMGMLPVLNTAFGFIPLHSHDIWLHAVTALIAAYVGWREPIAARERRRDGIDRRQRRVAVPHERRFGLADRRENFGGMSPA
jgi:hypothetical protein